MAGLNKVISFFKEVKAEVRKITWPGKNELIGSTIIVCIIVVIFAAILGSMDAGFGVVIRRLISY